MEIITIDLVYLQRLCKRTEKIIMLNLIYIFTIGRYWPAHQWTMHITILMEGLLNIYCGITGKVQYSIQFHFMTVLAPTTCLIPWVPCFCNLGRELRDHYTCNHASSFSQTYMGWSKDGFIHVYKNVYKNVMLAPS